MIKINLVKQQPVIHPEGRVSLNALPLELKLDNRNRLMDLRIQFEILHIIILVIGNLKQLAVYVLIGIKRKGRKRYQINSVPLFQRIQAPVTGRDPKDRCDTGGTACCRSHPDDIVISPLDIDGMIVSEGIHNDMRSRPPVKDIAYDMQMIND